MLFFDTTNQPSPLREIIYTVALKGIEPITVQKGGVQGEHRATRLQFNLDETFKSWCLSLLGKSRLFCRADACDGSGVVHRSLTLEMTAEMINSGCFYYDLDQSVTRQGGFVKLCLVFSLLDNKNATWATVKSYYVTVELDVSPTYIEEDYHDMTDMFVQTKNYGEQARANATIAMEYKEAAKDALLAVQNSTKEAKVYAEAIQTAISSLEASARQISKYVNESRNYSAAADASAKNAEQSLKDVKNAFEAVLRVIDDTETVIPVSNNYEIRCTSPLTSMELQLPNVTADEKLSALISFKTPADTDMNLQYSTADIYFSNDDCENGVFIPLRNKMYDVAIYWNGLKYQGIVRGVAL